MSRMTWFFAAFSTLAVVLSGVTAQAQQQAQDESLNLSKEAAICVKNGEISGAELKLKQLLEKYPSSQKAPAAKLQLAFLKYKKSAPKAELISSMEEVAAAYPDSPEAAEALYYAAQTRLRRVDLMTNPNEFDEAIAAFEKASAHPKASHESIARSKMQGAFTHLMIFNKFKNNQALSTAVTKLESCAKEFADLPEIKAHALLGVGEAQILQKDFKAAEKAYDFVSKMDAKGLSFEASLAVYGLAMVRSNQNDSEGMKNLLDAYLASISGNTPAEKEAAWKAGYKGSYAVRGKSLVGSAYVGLAQIKHQSGDSLTAYNDLSALCNQLQDKASLKKVEALKKQIADVLQPGILKKAEVAK